MGNVWSGIKSAASYCWNVVKTAFTTVVTTVIRPVIKVVHEVVKRVVQQFSRYFYNQKGKIIIDLYSDCLSHRILDI